MIDFTNNSPQRGTEVRIFKIELPINPSDCSPLNDDFDKQSNESKQPTWEAGEMDLCNTISCLFAVSS